MGFLLSADTVTITAKLTPIGRQRLLTDGGNIITQFSLGDSDANYFGSLPLSRGEVPTSSGEIGFNGAFSNGIHSGVMIKSPILVNSIGDTKKSVNGGSSEVVITTKHIGVKTQTTTSLTQLIVDRTQGDSDSYSNLFKTFGLPITPSQKIAYSNIKLPTGYLDSAIKNLNQDKVLVISIDKCDYGETIDGKTIKVELTTTGGTTYTLYSTYQKGASQPTTLDTQFSENSDLGNAVNNNITFLFSDNVERPNKNENKSWATGYNTVRPFTLNGKETFNRAEIPSTSTNIDFALGVAYLDKGFIVITHPDIVNNFDVTSNATTVTYNSVSNEVAQNVRCIIERDEFATTTNPTHGSGDLIRVSEIALYDSTNTVIAYAKSNEHITIGANQYMVLGIRILV